MIAAAVRAPSGATQALLVKVHGRGWTWQQIGDELGVTPRRVAALLEQENISVELAAAVIEMAETLAVRPAWETRTWPTAPLVAMLVARYGALGEIPDTNQRRNLYRHTEIGWRTADRYACSHGWHPFQVWGPAWYGWDDGIEDIEEAS